MDFLNFVSVYPVSKIAKEVVAEPLWRSFPMLLGVLCKTMRQCLSSEHFYMCVSCGDVVFVKCYPE
jgi:hypothetical protein